MVKVGKKMLVSAIFLILLTINVKAGTLADISLSQDRYTLVHGESGKVTISVRNYNTFCSISCYYYKDRNYNQKYSLGSINPSKTPILTSFEIKAPSKGTNDITVYVEIFCGESKVGFCTSEPTDEAGTAIFKVDLTLEEKEAKQFIENNLLPLTDKIRETDTTFKRYESKINSLEKNVKIGNLGNDFIVYLNSINTLKKEIGNIESQYENEDYILAKSNYKISFATDITNLNNKLAEFENKLKEILEKHNKVIDAIKKLSNGINSLLSYSAILNKKSEVDILSDKVKSLETDFNRGNFDTYEKILLDIGNLDSEISNKVSSYQKEINSIVEKGTNLVSNEFDRVCNVKSYCNFDKRINILNDEFKDLKSICNKISIDLNNVLFQANDIDWQKYNQKIDEIKLENNKIEGKNRQIEEQNREITDFNDKVKNQNEKVQELNLLIEEINSLLKKNRLQINGANCSSKINNLKDLELSERNITIPNVREVCTSLKNIITDEIQIKEKTFLFKFKRLFFFVAPYGGERLPVINKLDLKPTLDKKQLMPINIEKPQDIEFSIDIKTYSTNYCDFDLSRIERKISAVREVNLKEDTSINSDFNIVLEEKEGLCCILGKCEKCCDDETCRNDPSKYPVVFVHGHSSAYASDVRNSIDAFRKIQSKLNDDGFLSQGIFLPDPKYKIEYGKLGKFNFPMTFRTTYYIGAYDENGNKIGDEKSKHIDEYAQELGKAIDIILYNTGKQKVNIVAHSMGGLVTRAYIKNYGGANKVDKLITIGTPNHGVWKRDGITFFCGVDVLFFRPECDDMNHDSTFVKNLNSGDETPSPVKYMTIASNSDVSIVGEQYDGVIRISSTYLDGATNNVIPKGTITGNTHSRILDPIEFQQVYNYVKDFLKS